VRARHGRVKMHHGISVLIPVYNGARYLSECIQSVCDQTLPATEIIIIDDGSEDDTPKVATEWGSRVRYQRMAHRGVSGARNHGLRLAEADVVAFIDSDDVWLPEKLQRQIAALSRANEPAMVFGYVQQFVSSDLTSEEAAQLKINTAPLPGLFPSTLLMRKSDCDRVGPFDESLQTGEFIEWCARASDEGIKTITVPEIVCRRRLHRNNSGRGGAVHGGYVRMLKKVLDRRRGQE
jgi:glycosyltransferase involved in cell wall biosynthesis